MSQRSVYMCLVSFVALVLLGCSNEKPPAQSEGLAGVYAVTSGWRYYVSNQSEFESALYSVASGDTITITHSGWYDMVSGCIWEGGSCLDGVRLEATGFASINFVPFSCCPYFTNASWENIALVWSPYTPGGGYGVTFQDSDIKNVSTFLGSECQSCAPVVCEGNVTVTSCPLIKLAVASWATVDVYGNTSFLGASDQCDLGDGTVETDGDLQVHEWWYGGKTYGTADPLITSTDVAAMSGCMWGYIRIGVADSDADVGTVYYGDEDCTEYQTSTTVIGGYHYASIRIDYFTDGDFYWKADIGYCSGNDWGAESTSCTRARKSRGIPGCPDPWWWPW